MFSFVVGSSFSLVMNIYLHMLASNTMIFASFNSITMGVTCGAEKLPTLPEHQSSLRFKWGSCYSIFSHVWIFVSLIVSLPNFLLALAIVFPSNTNLLVGELVFQEGQAVPA